MNIALRLAFSIACIAFSIATAAAAPRGRVLEDAQLVMVKVYGTGGVAGLEAYQTGFFVDAAGVVLTVDSPVLDLDRVTLVDAFGDRVEARVAGRDAVTGLALVVPERMEPPAVVDFESAQRPASSESVWVISNAFGIAAGEEPLTVQRARVAVLAPMPLPAESRGSERRRIGVPAPSTPVLLFDAVTSNPGAGGGLAIDDTGRPIGVVGAECRSPLTGTWINYALPISAAAEAIERMRSDSQADPSLDARQAAPPRWRPVLCEIGLVLLPEVASPTPAYIEHAEAGSPAHNAGCRPDDLIVAVDGTTVGDVERAGAFIAAALRREGRAELTVLRDRGVVSLFLSRHAP